MSVLLVISGIILFGVFTFLIFKGWIGSFLGLELVSTALFMGGLALVVASKDPLLISVLLLLLFKRQSYSPQLEHEYDYWSVGLDLESP